MYRWLSQSPPSCKPASDALAASTDNTTSDTRLAIHYYPRSNFEAFRMSPFLYSCLSSTALPRYLNLLFTTFGLAFLFAFGTFLTCFAVFTHSNRDRLL